MMSKRRSLSLTLGLLLILATLASPATARAAAPPPPVRFVILLIADGWGPNHIAAANSYTGSTPAYQLWPRQWMSTYAAGGSYDAAQAWIDFDYVKQNPTDSAAAATALYSGVKTANGRISVDATGANRLFTISEKGRALGMAAGAVTSVQIGHATPGAWEAHNDARGNGYAISDEGLWGNPNTTGTVADSSKYGGGHGVTIPPLDVLIGGGHPAWNTSYTNMAMRDRLATESAASAAFAFVERLAGSADGGARLLAAAGSPDVTRLVGLFGGAGGNLTYRLADGSGQNGEEPTLAEMAEAALAVLGRDGEGFTLMIEGGAVDWAAHSNRMDEMVGEMIGFNEAVGRVIDWVEDGGNGSSWANTLVIITGDHETGYLTAGPGVFQQQPLGQVSGATLALEKDVNGGGRASWEDGANAGVIDAGETVYWAWNSGSHTNTLIPLYAKGVGADLFSSYASGNDPVRGAYLDNTDVFRIMDAVLVRPLFLSLILSGDDVDLSWQPAQPASSYEVWRSDAPYFDFDSAEAELIHTLAASSSLMQATDSAILGPPPSRIFYRVRGLNGGTSYGRSQGNGVFRYALRAGN